MSFEGDKHDFYLPNGLKVIIYEKHTYPTVALNVIYDIGSHDDPIGKKGMAHVMANLMFEGSKNYKKHEQSIFQIKNKENAQEVHRFPAMTSSHD